MSNIKKFRIKYFKKDNTILKLEKISLKFGKKIILDNLNLNLNNGQILGLLGPNGVGKSTIFNLITGLISPDYGSIIIDSNKVNKYPIYQRTLKFKIGFVPQHGGYFHDLTVLENLKAISRILNEDGKTEINFNIKVNDKTLKFKLKFKLSKIIFFPNLRDIFSSFKIVLSFLKYFILNFLIFDI